MRRWKTPAREGYPTDRLNAIHSSLFIVQPRLGTNSPSRRPFGLLFGGFDARMEPGFILITNWNIDLYGVPELGEETGGRKAGHSAVRPGFVSRDGLFVRHKIS